MTWTLRVMVVCGGVSRDTRRAVTAKDLNLTQDREDLAAPLAEGGQPYAQFLSHESIWDAVGGISC